MLTATIRPKARTLVTWFLALTIGLAPLAPASSSPLQTPATSDTHWAKVLHVQNSHEQAADRNPGTEQRPLRTISEAVQRATEASERGIATKILVHGGTYREDIEIKGPDLRAPVALLGVDNPVVSGSDVWRGWRRLGSSNVFVKRWPHKWGLSPIPSGWESIGPYLKKNPLIRRREMLFVGGTHLSQVNRKPQVRARAGSFFVHQRRGKVFVHLPKGTATNDPAVEVAMRPRLLLISDVSDVQVQGFLFRHAATALGAGGAVATTSAARILFANNRFVWNNGIGMTFSRSEDIVMQGNIANHNGIGGITGAKTQRLVMIDNETSYNNWRGSMGWGDEGRVIDQNLTDFATGQKFLHLRDALFLRHRSVGNLTGGLWFDYDNARVLVKSATLVGNRTHGIFIEANQGPVTVKASAICNNESGVLIQNSRDGSLVGNTIKGNTIGQIFLAGALGPRTVTDYETGDTMTIKSENWLFRANQVAVSQKQNALGTILPADAWKGFISTLHSGSNLWSHEGRSQIFQVAGGRVLDLNGWQDHSTQDQDSAGAPAAPVDCPSI